MFKFYRNMHDACINKKLQLSKLRYKLEKEKEKTLKIVSVI